ICRMAMVALLLRWRRNSSSWLPVKARGEGARGVGALAGDPAACDPACGPRSGSGGRRRRTRCVGRALLDSSSALGDGDTARSELVGCALRAMQARTFASATAYSQADGDLRWRNAAHYR